MAKRNNNISGRLSRLAGAKVDGQSIQRLLTPSTLVTPSQPGSDKVLKAPATSDTRASSLTAKTVPTGIKFGSPSSSKTTTSQSGSIWGNLLKQTASGGVSSVFTGGLGSIAGLGGLISGIASLFGGGSSGSTLPPLVDFQLPASQTQTVYVSSNGGSYQGSPTLPTSNSAPVGQPFQYQSAQIAQAVKNALLNSSSLNDVIAEI